MMAANSIQEFLRGRGCPEALVAAGLEGLVEGWERMATEVEAGYALGLDDYLNDLDARELIEEILAHEPQAATTRLAARLREADERMRTALVPVGSCLWGDSLAAMHGWTAARNWWYFMRPRNPGEELRADLGKMLV